MIDCLWLRKVYPLRLREYIFYTYVIKNLHLEPEWLESASLVFAPSVRLTVLASDFSHQCILMNGFYELDLTRRIAELAGKRGGLLVDAGANAGYYSCLWAALNPDNKVIAFEPSPQCNELLKKNAGNNGFVDRIDIRRTALSNENGLAWFRGNDRRQTGWGGLSREKTEDAIQVPVMRLDDYMKSVQTPISVLKIDTEGADALVLQGAQRLLSEKRIPHIFFEVNAYRMSFLGLQKDACHRVLETCGYRVKRLNNGNWHAFPA